MFERSPFGIRLWRLMASRSGPEMSIERHAAMLAREAGVSSTELDAVIKGAEPSPHVIRQLGPALGIHTADMFVIAGLPVPLDLASAWPTRPWNVGTIVRYAIPMNADQCSRLNDVVRSLPLQPPTELSPTDDYPEAPGALMLRLLKNRNISPYNARILFAVGGGPYVSNSTMAMLGPGKTVMTPQYVTAFAHLLGYAPQDLVALAGVGPVIEDAPVHPASSEIAALAWNARRLNSDQIGQVQAASRRI